MYRGRRQGGTKQHEKNLAARAKPGGVWAITPWQTHNGGAQGEHRLRKMGTEHVARPSSDKYRGLQLWLPDGRQSELEAR